MSCIMTDRGWVQLTPKIDMAVIERVSFNPITKQYEKDDYFGTLREIGRIDHAPASFQPYDWEAYFAREAAFQRDVLGVEPPKYGDNTGLKTLESSKYS